MNYGYARVSTNGQTLDAQLAQLKAGGGGKIFRETASGADGERAQLKRAIAALVSGDVLIVTRLDRLARSTTDLLNSLSAIMAKGAGIRSLAEPWADTTTPHGRLVTTIMGGFAEFERDLIRQRTTEGRIRAKELGQHMGRPPALTRQQTAEARQRRKDGATLAELAASYNVSKATISRLSRVPA
jgi:DNA invertase Pin-like site-specific DNA recombinase